MTDVYNTWQRPTEGTIPSQLINSISVVSGVSNSINERSGTVSSNGWGLDHLRLKTIFQTWIQMSTYVGKKILLYLVSHVLFDKVLPLYQITGI